MKTQKIRITFLAAALLMFIGTNLFAQKGMGNNREQGQGYGNHSSCTNIPDLTDEQKQKIETLRVAHLKMMNDFRNQKNELRAKKQTLMSSDKTDLTAINSVIDQMTGLQNKMMKEGAKHNQEVRSLLTDAQKVYFDSKHMKGDDHRHGRGMGEHKGDGTGPNCPQNQSDNQ